METKQSLPELIAATHANAEACEVRIAAVRNVLEGKSGTDAQVEDLRAACVELERLAVDTFTLFEARMQHHFKRGPLSRKLKAKLLEAGRSDLANRVHQYYLAINVLKHGTGASYRELLDTSNPLIPVKPVVRDHLEQEHAPSDLIDVSQPGFFEGLTTTLVEAHQFLEDR